MTSGWESIEEMKSRSAIVISRRVRRLVSRIWLMTSVASLFLCVIRKRFVRNRARPDWTGAVALRAGHTLTVSHFPESHSGCSLEITCGVFSRLVMPSGCDRRSRRRRTPVGDLHCEAAKSLRRRRYQICPGLCRSQS